MTRYFIVTIDCTESATPTDPEAALEIARALLAAASRVERAGLIDGDQDVCGTQGQRVGRVQLADSAPFGDPTGYAARLVVKCGDATTADRGHEEIVHILRQVAARVGRGDHLFTLRTPDGAVTGKFEWREPLQTQGMQP